MSAVLRGNLRMTLSGIKAAKWRSFLTMLGIVVGVVAVVMVVGIGEGVKRQVAGALDHFGKDLIVIRPAQDATRPGALAAGSDVIFGMTSTVGLRTSDIATVRKAEGVGLSSPLSVVPGTVEVEGHAARSTVVSASADLPQLVRQDLSYGDFWTAEDEDAHFAVLGSKTAEALFGEPVPLGKSFIFRGLSFQVRGIFKPFAAVPFSPTANFDSAVFIPYKTAIRLTNGAAPPYVILAKPTASAQVGSTIRTIRHDLGQANGSDRDASVLASRQSLESGNGVIGLLSMWIFAVAVIALIMGGVGIMNIMLLVVTERLHEIGVRKAVGATSRQIMGQFMMEATVISVVGGVIGIALSSAVIGVLYVYTDLKPVLSWQAVVIAAGASIVIGIVFGTIPAIKAARKDPIQALRHE